jgi:uncharacterized protein (TIGR02246 family)
VTNTEVVTDETAVKDVLTRMVSAWDANDADSFANLYTEDTSVVTSQGHTQGRKALAGFMAAGFGGPLKGTTSVEDVKNVRFATEDVAIVNTLSGFKFPGETEVQPALLRRATWVMTRTADGWLVDAYHNCPAS